MTRRAIALLIALLLPRPAPAADPEPTSPAPVLLVSLDGVRADLMNRRLMPRLARMTAEGVRARWMTPSYPALTFPNHYTLVTGLRPDRHGLVHNSMRVDGLGRFSTKDATATGDGRWWSQAEPLWVTAERAGLPTASMFWPGGNAEIGGQRPRDWQLFDESVDETRRVDTVLAWLRRPAATRPRFALLYFDLFDHEAHEHGPDSTQARTALKRLDTAIGWLLDGLRAQGQLDAVNVIVVSDHGMAAVPRGHRLPIASLVPSALAEVESVGQVLQVRPRSGHEAQSEKALLGRHSHHRCWRRAKLPARWHYGRNARIAPIVCQMDEGWEAVLPDELARTRGAGTRGAHGYDPALHSMRALFVARGPAFRKGAELPAIDNVDVYPLLAKLLGVMPEPNDGDAPALDKALAPR